MEKLIDIKSNTGFRINNKSTSVAEIIIYQEIGRSDFFNDNLSAKDFSNELKKIPETVSTIEVRINSLGGDVFDGVTIYSRLRNHKAKKIVYIDGIAASIASIIAMAGDEIRISEGGTMMIHKPWTFAVGNARDLEDIIDRLNDVEERMLNIYSSRIKKEIDREEIRAMLADEKWMDADEAVELGFATEVMDREAMPIAASADKASWLKKKPQLKTQADYTKQKTLKLKEELKGKLARN